MTLKDPLAGGDAPQNSIPIPPAVLRGPADADHYRTQVGNSKHRWYIDPLPADDVWPETTEDTYWPAVSTVKKASGADWTRVGLARVAKATAGKRGRFDDLSEEQIYKMLDADNWNGLDAASLRGTNVHTYFEMGLRGHPIQYQHHANEPGAEYLGAVRSFFLAYKPRLLVAEYVTLDRDLNGVGYGGTGDAIIEMDNKAHDARVIAAVDWKSRKDEGKQTAYAEEAAQVSANARAQYMIVEGPNGPERRALPPCDLGAIISIRPDGCRVYPIDLDKGWVHWTAMHAWWVARKTERDSIGRVWPAAKVPTLEALLAEITSTEDANELWRLFKTEWTAEHTRLAKERLAALDSALTGV